MKVKSNEIFIFSQHLRKGGFEAEARVGKHLFWSKYLLFLINQTAF